MKKALLLFMAVLALGVTARAADGDEFTVDNFKYEVLSEADHEVSIKGYKTQPTGDIVIPSYVSNNSSRYFVTSIGDYAFYRCRSLTSVTIPNSVTKIGDNAFSGCSSLTSATIPNSVTEILGDAFYECSSLTSVTIPNSVTEISNYAFFGCSSLTSVTIPNSVTEIGGSAFRECSSLTSVTIPNSVTSIYANAFRECSSLPSVTIPNSVTKISGGAFGDCTSLEVILVEEGNTKYTSKGGVLFNKEMTTLVQCPGTKESYAIPNSVTEIGYNAFSGCSGLTSVTIPNSVTKIGDGAFSACSSLASVTIPNSVTKIGSDAFSGCSSLTSVTIPNSVTEISYDAFSGCSSLTSVTIPNSVTEIGHDAFSGCSSLKTIFALPSTPPGCGNKVFDNVPTDAVVYIPKGTLKAYFVADGWSHFTDFREMGALDITMSETELKLHKGETITITATVSNDDNMTIESETWGTSNPEVATVEAGVVTAVTEGTATISFTAVDGYGIPHTETCEVTVNEESGIEDINADGSNAPAEYFNLQGVRIDNPENGFYIKRQGGKATKVLVK